jgi:hypothetical protein
MTGKTRGSMPCGPGFTMIKKMMITGSKPTGFSTPPGHRVQNRRDLDIFSTILSTGFLINYHLISIH